MNMKGSLPLLILQIVASSPKHGYQIAQMIKQFSQGLLDFKEGTLYPTLHGLEQQGYLEAFSSEENGRTRRYYRLTASGKLALEKERKEWHAFVQAVNLTLESAS